MNVWITKDVVRRGIKFFADCEIDPQFPTIITVRDDGWKVDYSGDEWHTSFASALAKAEKMRSARIKSLEKSLAKLRAKVFVDLTTGLAGDDTEGRGS